jgi:hypothetical protein
MIGYNVLEIISARPLDIHENKTPVHYVATLVLSFDAVWLIRLRDYVVPPYDVAAQTSENICLPTPRFSAISYASPFLIAYT